VLGLLCLTKSVRDLKHHTSSKEHLPKLKGFFQKMELKINPSLCEEFIFLAHGVNDPSICVNIQIYIFRIFCDLRKSFRG
jgi:hypothetical protein